MAKLVMFLADGKSVDIPLSKERITIGRRADNDVCLPNLAVSGDHAAVVTILDDSFLEDLGSTNGTLVHGQPITKHFLRDGDRIDIGRHKLVYCDDDDAVVTPTVPDSQVRVGLRDLVERVDAVRPIVQFNVEPAGSRMPDAAMLPARADRLELPGKSEPAQASLPRVASIRILSGPNAGRAIALNKDQTTIGRPGIQVAAILVGADTYRLRLLEGKVPPLINGKPVEGEEVRLNAGDVIEIAETRLEFIGPPAPLIAALV